jgi:predicted ester cyclase
LYVNRPLPSSFQVTIFLTNPLEITCKLVFGGTHEGISSR